MFQTYHRKRKKSQLATDTMEMKQCYDVPIQQASSVNHNFMFRGTGDKSQIQGFIKVGEMYEIDHSHLPARAPLQLKYVRVAMVCEMTETSVSVRFPSTESLRAFFSFSTRETHPALDEKFVMGRISAVKVLLRLVPIDVYHEKKCLETFWLISLSSAADLVRESRFRNDDKVGDCLSNLNCDGMVKWGVRRQVKYLGRHKEEDDDVGGVNDGGNPSSNLLNRAEDDGVVVSGVVESMNDEETDGEFEEDNEDGEEENEDNDDGDDEEDGCQVEKEEEDDKSKVDLKRKRYDFRKLVAKKPKKEKVSKKNVRKNKQKIQPKKTKPRNKNKEAIILRNPKDRWSAERYMLAEKNLLEVMKSKGATAENPIVRPQLRAEARKKIGDTGLLDHLLKHMAGKLAPGGKERFRRRHNADGAMEYWLEDPNLINIRKQAGVSDPYWVPPQGWKLGDSPNQDPVCARELRALRDEVSMIRRDMEMMATKMHLEEEVGKMRRELRELVEALKNCQEQSQSKEDELTASLASSKRDLGQAPATTLEKYKEQLVNLNDVVKEVERKLGISTLEQELPDEDSPLNVHTQPAYDQSNKAKQLFRTTSKTSEHSYNDQMNTNNVNAEDKAAKIQRLKSGFRLCRPQGSFLWPNMVKNNNHFITNSNSNVLTPPSVTSSSSHASEKIINYLIPTSPVKPVAERRGVKVMGSTQATSVEGGACNDYSTNNASLINLNDAPTILNAMPMLSSPAYGAMQQNTSFSSSPDSDRYHWLGLAGNFNSSADGSKHG